MTTITEHEMITALTKFASVYNAPPLTELQIATYWDVLEGMRPIELQRAVRKVLREHENFMPSPAIILKASEPTAEDIAEFQKAHALSWDEGKVFNDTKTEDVKKMITKLYKKFDLSNKLGDG